MNEWQNAEQHAERAQQFYESGQWGKALNELRRTLSVNPHQSEWHFGMGLTLDAMQRHAEAAVCFQRALRLQGDDLETMIHLAADLIQCGRFWKALSVLHRANEIDPEEERAYCYQILAYARLGEHEQAEQAFYMARQIEDDCPLCYDHIAQSLVHCGQYDRAIWCWRHVLRLDPNYPDVHANLGRAHWANGELNRARLSFEQQLRQVPDDAQTLVHLGKLLMAVGQPGVATERLHQALDVDPSLADAHLHLGELCMSHGHLDNAAEALQTAARCGPDRPGIHLLLEKMSCRRGCLDHARRHLRRELTRRGHSGEQALALARMLLEFGFARSVDDLLTPFVEAAARSPARGSFLTTALVYRGAARIIIDDMDHGIANCRRALRQSPENQFALENLVRANLDQGRLSHAHIWLKRLARLRTHSDPLVHRLRCRLTGARLLAHLRKMFRTPR